MSVASMQFIPEELKTSIVRIYSYEDKNPQGVLYNPFYGKEQVFMNLTQFLLQMENMMDSLKFPQATVRARRFESGQEACEAFIAMPKPAQEAIATFKVKVLFRQGASWQGKLGWLEGGQEIAFRSVLELVKLMDSAIPQTKGAIIPEQASAG